MSDTDFIDEESVGEDALPAGVVEAAAAGAAAVLCISCGAKVVGAWCHACGQKNDDMRRSLLRLARDFLEDTFAFDSRMWRTLGLMAARPGRVPTDYAHGKRSQYTPPVRLFLVVSFLFFLTLGLTDTMFVAMDVRATPREEAAAGGSGVIKVEREGAVLDYDARNCDINAGLRFFVRPKDLALDTEAWRRCSEGVERSVADALRSAEAESDKPRVEEETARALGIVSGAIGGVSRAVENPRAFNADINVWLPRVMFLMTPVLALLLAFFLRGRNALLFDNMVFSLYTHAAGFAIIGIAVIAAQFGLRWMFPAAMAAMAAYFIVAIRRAYGRGWVKTVWTGAAAGLLYVSILTTVVAAIVANSLMGDA